MFRTDLWKFSQRVGRAVVILLATAVMSVGCGKQFDVGDMEERSQEDENLIVVGVSQVGSESVWRTANTASIQDVFTRENGYLLIFDNARQKQENQIKAIRSFISQQVDYIVFSPIEEIASPAPTSRLFPRISLTYTIEYDIISCGPEPVSGDR